MLSFRVPGATSEKFVLAIVLLDAFLHGQGHERPLRLSGSGGCRPGTIRSTTRSVPLSRQARASLDRSNAGRPFRTGQNASMGQEAHWPGQCRDPTAWFHRRNLMTAWKHCEGRCAVSGLEFSETQVGGGKARRPYAPSLDRIDPRRGYEPDNVRLVCAVANFAMNAWGLNPFSIWQGHGQKACRRDWRSWRSLWLARRDAKIAEAERQATHLAGEAQVQARRRIAALKRARTPGTGRPACCGGEGDGD